MDNKPDIIIIGCGAPGIIAAKILTHITPGLSVLHVSQPQEQNKPLNELIEPITYKLTNHVQSEPKPKETRQERRKRKRNKKR